MSSRPVLVYADAKGNIFDFPELEMAGSNGGNWHRLSPKEWIPLPEGSELFLLPKRLPVGYHPGNKVFKVLTQDPYEPTSQVQAVAAFMAPAHTQIFSAAYQTLPGAKVLPLFAYTAVGWHNDRFVAAGYRVDSDERQDFQHFDLQKIEKNARRRMAQEPLNRLIQHLGKCALTFSCPAARNLFMDRWEAPLPTSPVCNASCLGCISQQDHPDICATQDRIAFVPTPEEILAIAGPHLKNASNAVVSFGQGCEGEPLLQAKTLQQSIVLMRETTERGTINLNSNASLPNAVEMLRIAGLDSMRVSLNSCQPQFYEAYYQPKSYTFNDVIQSIKIMKAMGGFVSINYFVLPGFTDDQTEWDTLRSLIDETKLDLIQLRNLNIDPEWYLSRLNFQPHGKQIGVRKIIETLKTEFPQVRLGYFNPPLNVTRD